MKCIPTALADVLIFEPKVFADDRGFFYESFNAQVFAKLSGLNYQFVQDNHSRSQKGVLRGLHFQLPPKAQGKLVRVVLGEVYDVAVDLRPESPNFKKWVAVYLSASNHRQLWIPPGFAHGFYVCSEVAEFLYKTTDYYSPEHEQCLAWNDHELNIDFPLDGLSPNVSAKDQQGLSLAETELLLKSSK